MMNKAIILVCLGLVASTLCANGGIVLGLFGSGSKVDFDGLNKWLVKSLPEESDVDKNVAYVRSNMNNTKDSKIIRAAEIFVNLMEARHCNEKVFIAIKEILDSNVNMGGLKRIESIMATRQNFIDVYCGVFVDGRVETLYDTSLTKGLSNLIKEVVFNAFGWERPLGNFFEPWPDQKFFDYIEKGKSEELKNPYVDWKNHLKELAKEDPEAGSREWKLNEVTGKEELVRRKGNFKHIYKKYLVEPCQLLTKTLGDTVTVVYRLTKKNPKFLSDRSRAVKQLLYGFMRCKELLSLNPSGVKVYY